ncbi:MAG: hypothetical protein OCD02_14580 [Spirochaetaceae bacterium]
MTKTKYFISLLFALIIVFWGIISGGNSILLYLDIPTLIFVPILPFFISSFIYPFKIQREFNKEIFKPIGTGDKKSLEQAVSYYSLLRNLTIVGAIVAVFIGVIGMMANLEDISSVGRNTGVVCISIFYGVVFLLLVTEPLKGIAKRNLIG